MRPRRPVEAKAEVSEGASLLAGGWKAVGDGWWVAVAAGWGFGRHCHVVAEVKWDLAGFGVFWFVVGIWIRAFEAVQIHERLEGANGIWVLVDGDFDLMACESNTP